MYFEFLATLCAGLFAGAAIYISLVEHPARLECGTELAAAEFGPSYRRAALMQASLAALGLAAAIVAWVQARGLGFLVGGLLLGALDPALDRRSAETAALLLRWGRLHAVRSVTSGLAFGVLLWHLAVRG